MKPDNSFTFGDPEVKSDIPYEQREQLGEWPSMELGELKQAKHETLQNPVVQSWLETNGVFPRDGLNEKYKFDGHMPDPEEMELHEDPGSFNMDEELVVKADSTVRLHLKSVYKLQTVLKFFRFWLVQPDGSCRSFNLQDCYSESNVPRPLDPHGRPRLVLLGHQNKGYLHFRFEKHKHVRTLSDFNLKHDVDTVRCGEHVWHRNFLRTHRGLMAGEVYRYDPFYRTRSKRQPVRIVLYWRSFQTVEIEDDRDWLDLFRNKLRIEKERYLKENTPNPFYDGDNQDFYFKAKEFH